MVGLISLSLGDLQGHLYLSCSPCTSAKPFEENRLFSGAIHWTWWRCLCLDEMTCTLEDGVVFPHDYKKWQDDFRCVYLHLTRGIPRMVPRIVSECWGSPEMSLQEHNPFHANIVNRVGLNWPLAPLFRETWIQLWNLWHGAGLEHIGTIFMFIKNTDSCLKAQHSYLPKSSSILPYEQLH